MTRSEDNGTFASIESSPFGFGDVLYAPCYFTSGAEFLATAEAGLKELEKDRSTGPPCDHCALVFPATMGSIDGAEERYAKAAAAARSGDGLHYRLKRTPRDTLGFAAAYPATHKRLFGGRTFRWISYRANVLRVVAGRGGGEDNRGPPADGRVLRCVEINQCVGCTMTRPSRLRRAVLKEPAPPRRRAGVASMAWRSTRRFSKNVP